MISAVHYAIQLIESKDFSLASWEQCIATAGDLQELIATTRSALDYFSNAGQMKGIPKKAWKNAIIRMRSSDLPEETKEDAERLIAEAEKCISSN